MSETKHPLSVSLNDAILAIRNRCNSRSRCDLCEFNLNRDEKCISIRCMFEEWHPGDWEPISDIDEVSEPSEIEHTAYEYGIYDAETLKSVLDTYQTILIELTGNLMSKLDYTSDAILKVIYDRMEGRFSHDTDRT